MGNKKDYKLANRQILKDLSKREDVTKIAQGLFYEILKPGEGTTSPSSNSVVTVQYKGSLINGEIFDSSYERPCPEAFRVREVIEGWQLALQKMHKGDKWRIYIAPELGYGNKTIDNIPGNSTLIFEVELLDFQ